MELSHSRLKKMAKKDKQEVIEGIKSLINSKYANLIKRADEIEGTAYLRRPTGIPNLDFDLKGGLPKGFHILLGEKNSGKTYLLYKICKTAQELYGQDCKILIVAGEAFDKDFAKNCGFKVPYSPGEIETAKQAYRAQYGRDLTDKQIEYLKESVGIVDIVQYGTAEEQLQIIYEAAKSQYYQIIGLDSMGSLVTSEESEKTLDEDSRAAKARVLKKFCQKMWTVDNKTTIVAINHISAKQNASPYEKQYINSGGNAKDHLAINIIYLKSGEKIKDKNGKIIGKYINYGFDKGKWGTHEGIWGSFNFYFESQEEGKLMGTDSYIDLFELAQRTNFILKDGQNYKIYDDIVNIRSVFKHLKDNKMYDRIMSDIYKQNNIVFTIK